MFKPKTKAATHAAKRKRVIPLERWDIVNGDKVFTIQLAPLEAQLFIHQVEVVAGQDKGAQGFVRVVMRSRNMLIAEGCRMVLLQLLHTLSHPSQHKRYAPPTEDNEGGLLSSEAPIPYSELRLVDPTDK